MNSEELKEITQQLADVELPAAPEWQPLIIAMGVVIVAIVLAVVVIRLRSRGKGSNKVCDAGRDALYQLQLLRQEWQQNEVDDHDAAYRLATLLRLGLGLNQLTDAPPSSLQSEQPQWDEMMRLLTQLRYTPSPQPSPPRGRGGNVLSDETFAQIEQWLRKGNAPC
jgi:hypothetical protein